MEQSRTPARIGVGSRRGNEADFSKEETFNVQPAETNPRWCIRIALIVLVLETDIFYRPGSNDASPFLPVER